MYDYCMFFVSIWKRQKNKKKPVPLLSLSFRPNWSTGLSQPFNKSDHNEIWNYGQCDTGEDGRNFVQEVLMSLPSHQPLQCEKGGPPDLSAQTQTSLITNVLTLNYYQPGSGSGPQGAALAPLCCSIAGRLRCGGVIEGVVMNLQPKTCSRKEVAN